MSWSNSVHILLSVVCPFARRRFIWNYVRLENEHLFNCGNFRATRDIHLAALNPRQERMLESMMDESDGVSNRRKSNERIRLGKEYF